MICWRALLCGGAVECGRSSHGYRGWGGLDLATIGCCCRVLFVLAEYMYMDGCALSFETECGNIVVYIVCLPVGDSRRSAY